MRPPLVALDTAELRKLGGELEASGFAMPRLGVPEPAVA